MAYNDYAAGHPGLGLPSELSGGLLLISTALQISNCIIPVKHHTLTTAQIVEIRSRPEQSSLSKNLIQPLAPRHSYTLDLPGRWHGTVAQHLSVAADAYTETASCRFWLLIKCLSVRSHCYCQHPKERGVLAKCHTLTSMLPVL